MTGLIVLGAAVLLGEVFAVSVTGKLRSRAAFAAFAGSVPRMVPRIPGRPAAFAVVAGELAAVPLLVAAPLAGFVLAAVLLAAFGVAIGAALRAGRDAPCRCFGASSARLGPAQLVRAALLAAAAGLGAVVSGPSTTLLGGVEPGGAAVAVAAGTLLAAGAVLLDDIAFLFTQPGRT